jgi:O-antigen/teichoic acid export membrane protein
MTARVLASSTAGRRRSVNRSGTALAGNAAYALAQLGVLVVLARETSPSEVGEYALALAVTAPIQLGIGLRLRTVRAVDAGATPFSTYLRLGMILGALAAVLGTAIGALIARSPHFVAIVAVLAVAKSVEGLIDVCYGEYQRQDRLAAIAASQLLRAGLTISLVFWGVHIAGLLGALTAMLLGWSAQLWLLDARRVAHSNAFTVGDHSRSSTMGALVRRSWPLGLAAAIASLTVSMPRVVVSGLLDSAALGVLAVLSYPTIAVTLFANSVGQANVRELALKFDAQNRRALWSALWPMLAATGLLGIGGTGVIMLLGEDGVERVLGAAYASHFDVLLMLLLAATLAGFATNVYYLLVSTGRFTLQPLVIGATVLVSTPVVYVATLHLGLMGTASALVFMYALQGLLTAASAAYVLWRPSLPISRTGE